MKTDNNDIPKAQSSDPVTETKKLESLKTSIEQNKNYVLPPLCGSGRPGTVFDWGKQLLCYI